MQGCVCSGFYETDERNQKGRQVPDDLMICQFPIPTDPLIRKVLMMILLTAAIAVPIAIIAFIVFASWIIIARYGPTLRRLPVAADRRASRAPREQRPSNSPQERGYLMLRYTLPVIAVAIGLGSPPVRSTEPGKITVREALSLATALRNLDGHMIVTKQNGVEQTIMIPPGISSGSSGCESPMI